MLDNLEELLSSNPYSIEPEKEKQKGPSAVRITPGALDKIKTYARLVERITGTANECYGFLLSNKDDSSGLVADAYLADNQSYSGAHVSISGEDVVRASDAVDPEGYKIVGWWHSHARFGVFHSGTDVNNFKTIVHSVSPNTLKTEYEDIKLEELAKNGKVELGGYVFDTKELKDIEIKRKDTYSWAYSLVVNVMGDVYTEIQAKELCPDDEWRLKDPSKGAGYETVAVEDDISIDAKLLEDEVYEKLNVRRYTPLTKVAKPARKKSRRWGWFKFVDYVAGWLCGDSSNDSTITSIESKIQKSVGDLKERKKKNYEKKLEQEKKAEEEAEKYRYNELAEDFFDGAKAYIHDPKQPQSRFWLDHVISKYIQKKKGSFEEIVGSVNNPKTYSKLNYNKKKNKRKFAARFAKELEACSTLCGLVSDFIEDPDKQSVVGVLKLYKPGDEPKKEQAKPAEKPEDKQEVSQKAEAGEEYADAGQAAAESAEKNQKGTEIPVKVIKPEDDDELVALVKKELKQEGKNTLLRAKDFLEEFQDYVNNTKNYQQWARDTIKDFAYGYAGRGETFMRAGSCNNIDSKSMYNHSVYAGESSWRKEKMVEKATKEMLNSPEFVEFVNEFMKEKDKDSVVYKYFKREDEKKGRVIVRTDVSGWRYGHDAYGSRVMPGITPAHTGKGSGKQKTYSTYTPPKPSFEPTAAEKKKIVKRVYGKIFDDFFSSAKEYMLNDGEYSAWLGNFLIKMAEEKEDDIKKPIRKQIGKKTRETIENDSLAEKIKARYDWFAKEKPTEAEIKDRLFLEFIADFKPEAIPGFYNQMRKFTRNSFVADAFANSLADYIMERFEFNNEKCTRKYCAWAGNLLEDIIKPEEYITFGGALKKTGALSDDRLWSTDYFYTEKDRKMVSNQLLLDLTYFIKEDRQQEFESFLVDFVNAYRNSEEDPDAVLENFMKQFDEVEECKQPKK